MNNKLWCQYRYDDEVAKKRLYYKHDYGWNLETKELDARNTDFLNRIERQEDRMRAVISNCQKYKYVIFRNAKNERMISI